MNRAIYCLLVIYLIAACQSQTEVNYATHIYPIISKNCIKCHQPGEAAPFSLTHYTDLTKRGKMLVYVTKNRIMPPWPADPNYSHFVNETYLTPAEIDLIAQWVDEGCKAGDTSNLKQLNYTETIGLGKPDLIVKLPTIKIPGNNTDLFTVMKVPFEMEQDTFLKAVEFVCNNKKLVHHMNGHLICFENGKKTNLFSGKTWVNQDQTKSQEIHTELGLLNDDGSYPTLTPSVSNYLPGALFTAYPNGIGGYRINKKSAFYLNDMHYGPSPVDAYDSSYFKLYFDNKPPKRPVSEFQIGTLGLTPVEPFLSVPANTVKNFLIKYTIPNDISLVSIVPHMHLIGQSYWAYAIKPSGDTIPLIKIPTWDFRWQYFYQFKQLLKIPRGSTIYVHGVFDNTTNNPNNPFNPPQLIEEKQGSMRTTDEMFQLIVTYLPYQKGDENISLEP